VTIAKRLRSPSSSHDSRSGRLACGNGCSEQQQPERSELGAWPTRPVNQRVVERTPKEYVAWLSRLTAGLPAVTERSGVRRACGYDNALWHGGNSIQPKSGPVQRQANGGVGRFSSQWLGMPRYARQRLGVGRGQLASKLLGTPQDGSVGKAASISVSCVAVPGATFLSSSAGLPLQDPSGQPIRHFGFQLQKRYDHGRAWIAHCEHDQIDALRQASSRGGWFEPQPG